MPRLRTPDNTARRYLFGKPVATIARLVGWSRNTCYRRKEKPGEITLDELADLVRANGLDAEELYKLVTMRG